MTESEYQSLKRALEKKGGNVTYAVYEGAYAAQIFVCVERDASRSAIEQKYRNWVQEALGEVGLKAHVRLVEWNPTKRGQVSFEIWITSY